MRWRCSRGAHGALCLNAEGGETGLAEGFGGTRIPHLTHAKKSAMEWGTRPANAAVFSAPVEMTKSLRYTLGIRAAADLDLACGGVVARR